MQRPATTLHQQPGESARLDLSAEALAKVEAAIRKNLEGVGYGG